MGADLCLGFSPGKVLDDVRQLSSCIIGAGNPTGNMAHEAVLAVEMHLLQRGWPVGEALGALPNVQKALGLGRPTCREALIMLEARGLLTVRRGPGGGVFVAAPTADEVVGAILMYLTISGASLECIQEFRLQVWRMITEAAIDRGVGALPNAANAGEWGFAVDLARQVGNPAMALAAQIAEMLVRACEGRSAPAHDARLERALEASDIRRAFATLDDLASPMDQVAPLLALQAMERKFGSGHKSAMALAARMMREMIHRPEKLEAEWETAERLGYTGPVVRQARRILQDFGVVRCQRGRKGALWGQPISPAAVIRLLAPYLIANGVSARDNGDAAFYLASSAASLAAKRTSEGPGVPVKLLPSFEQSISLIDLFRVENLLLELGGNPLLAIMVRSLGLANFRTDGTPLAPAVSAEIAAFNRRILRAIERGDIEAAGALARSKAHVMRRPEDKIRTLA